MTTDGTSTTDGGAPKTFTQDEVNAIVQDRLARVKNETKIEPPADYEQLRAAAARLAQIEQANQSESEKFLNQLRSTEQERDAAKKAADEAVAAAKKEKLRSAVVSAAAKQKALDPEDTFVLLLNSAHKDAVTIGDDGQVTGAEDAVKALLEAKPHLVGTPQKPKPDSAQGSRDQSTLRGIDAGRERGRKDREAREATQRNPFEGMSVLGRSG